MMAGNKNMQYKDMSYKQNKKYAVWNMYVLRVHVKTAHVNTLLDAILQVSSFQEISWKSYWCHISVSLYALID